MKYANQLAGISVYREDMSVGIRFAQELKTLKNNYRRAWRRYLLEADVLRQVLENRATGTEPVGEVRARVEKAAEEYREARDLLAKFLLETAQGPKVMAAGQEAA